MNLSTEFRKEVTRARTRFMGEHPEAGQALCAFADHLIHYAGTLAGQNDEETLQNVLELLEARKPQDSLFEPEWTANRYEQLHLAIRKLINPPFGARRKEAAHGA